jgi:hypothetical protein
MTTKKNIKELGRLSSRQLSNHLEEMSQTKICKDKKYCAYVVKQFIKSTYEY